MDMMAIRRRVLMAQRRLPDEYQEVTYIESDGGQQISTGIPTDLLVTADLVAQFTVATGDSQVLLYAGSTNGVNWFGQRDGMYACGSSGSEKSDVPSTEKAKVHIEFYANRIACRIGDEEFYRTGATHQNRRIYTLFNIEAYPAKARVFACTIYNEGEKIADYVPCYRRADGEIGLYDTVSKAFLTNQGTGSFLKGENV